MAIDTQKYKLQLEEMLVTITGELAEIGVQDPENVSNWTEATPDLDTTSADPNDVADRTEEWGERKATLAVLETRYNNIRRALKKIEEGTYGVCEIGGEPIEEDRLDANPAARTSKAHMEEESSLPQ